MAMAILMRSLLAALMAVLGIASSPGAASKLGVRSVPRCAAPELAVTYQTQSTGMFHYSVLYKVRNAGSAKCSLDGYPTIAAYHADATNGTAQTRLGISVRRAPGSPRKPTPVTLGPGAAAGVVVSYNGDPSDGTCGTRSSNLTDVRLRLPDEKRFSARLPFGFNVCPSDGDRNVYVTAVLTDRQARIKLQSVTLWWSDPTT